MGYGVLIDNGSAMRTSFVTSSFVRMSEISVIYDIGTSNPNLWPFYINNQENALLEGLRAHHLGTTVGIEYPIYIQNCHNCTLKDPIHWSPDNPTDSYKLVELDVGTAYCNVIFSELMIWGGYAGTCDAATCSIWNKGSNNNIQPYGIGPTILPSTNCTDNIGSSVAQWNNIYICGTAYLEGFTQIGSSALTADEGSIYSVNTASSGTVQQWNQEYLLNPSTNSTSTSVGTVKTVGPGVSSSYSWTGGAIWVEQWYPTHRGSGALASIGGLLIKPEFGSNFAAPAVVNTLIPLELQAYGLASGGAPNGTITLAYALLVNSPGAGSGPLTIKNLEAVRINNQCNANTQYCYALVIDLQSGATGLNSGFFFNSNSNSQANGIMWGNGLAGSNLANIYYNGNNIQTSSISVNAVGGVGTATFAVGSSGTVGTGSNATCVSGSVCTSFSGTVTLITGSGATLSTGTVLTITTSITRSNNPNCAVWIYGGTVYVSPQPTTSHTTITVAVNVALLVETVYTVVYICGGI